jgi:hypothetical protein
VFNYFALYLGPQQTHRILFSLFVVYSIFSFLAYTYMKTSGVTRITNKNTVIYASSDNEKCTVRLMPCALVPLSICRKKSKATN